MKEEEGSTDPEVEKKRWYKELQCLKQVSKVMMVTMTMTIICNLSAQVIDWLSE